MLPQTIICIGRSGSGKGTQVGLLEKYLREQGPLIPSLHIETGQFFRAFIEEQGISAQLAKKIYLDGKRQPDFLAVSMWGYMLCKDYTGVEHLMFDGAPRSATEAQVVEDAFAFYDRFNSAKFAKPKVIYVDVPAEWSMARIHERGRIDDKTTEEIQNRTNWFETDVMSAIKFFESNPKFDLIHIKADKPVEEVHAEIISHLA